ncbi:hypothetical protein H4R19_000420 [Coemansia spiralis]|nr:hypothetical protein H4R19_000420 [Coemansia spiralis]
MDANPQPPPPPDDRQPHSDDSDDYSDCSEASSDHNQYIGTSSGVQRHDGGGNGQGMASRKWSESQRPLLTGLSPREQKRSMVRECNRISARRSRQKKKERVPGLEATVAKLNETVGSLQLQLATWVEFNAALDAGSAPDMPVDDTKDDEEQSVDDCLNSVGALANNLFHSVAQLQLLLDHIITMLSDFVGPA